MIESLLNKGSRIWLYAIISIGIVLRLYQFWDWSLTNDELSTLSRLKFDSLNQLVAKGIKIDGHPAFTQLFLYAWIKISSNNVFLIRLPFVIASVFSLYYFYKLSVNWLNQKAALIALSIFSISYPFVLYSQIARPYSFGILFTIAFAYYWLKIIQHKSSLKHLIGFILFGYFGIITHYFASFQIASLLLIGLFKLPKERIKIYIIGSISMALLFLPHLNITIHQFSIGGIYWLPEPEGSFVFRFIDYLFNSNPFLKKGIYFLPLLLLLISKNFYWKPKLHLLFLSLFLIPYFTAYFYSIHITPILQFSILLFSAPFFILFLTSFISKEVNDKILVSSILFILGVGLYSLTFEKKLYSKKSFANFKGVAKKVVEFNKSYGADYLTSFANSTNPSYLDFYFNKMEVQPNFDKSSFHEPKDIAEARNIIAKSNTPYLLMAYAGTEIPASVHEYAKETYPTIESHERFFNSEVILYKNSQEKRKRIFSTHYEDHINNPKWQVIKSSIQDSIYRSNPISFRMDSTTEYALTYKDTVRNLYTEEHNFLTIKVWIKSKALKSAKLVLNVNRGGEVIDWKGVDFGSYWTKDEWYQVIFVYENRYFVKNSDEISIYIWNPENEEFFIDDFEILNFVDSDYNYYEN